MNLWIFLSICTFAAKNDILSWKYQNLMVLIEKFTTTSNVIRSRTYVTWLLFTSLSNRRFGETKYRISYPDIGTVMVALNCKFLFSNTKKIAFAASVWNEHLWNTHRHACSNNTTEKGPRIATYSRSNAWYLQRVWISRVRYGNISFYRNN